ncbi:MAG: hypothetical protein ACE5EF_13200, partial [Dehalococcoidia bacterium]
MTPWGIVGSGVLSGKYNRDPEAEGRARMRGQIDERQLRIAAEGNIIPLVGGKTVTQLEENVGSLDVQLTAEQRARLDDVSAIDPGFPHDMLRPQAQAQATARRVENHRASITPEW